jgi:DNA polymerase III epsilon subunit-like protein
MANLDKTPARTVDKTDGTTTVFNKQGRFIDNLPSKVILKLKKKNAKKVAAMIENASYDPMANEYDSNQAIIHLKELHEADRQLEVETGRADIFTDIAFGMQDFLDRDEVSTLTDSARDYYEGAVIKNMLKNDTFPTFKQASEFDYQTTLDLMENRLSEHYNGDVPQELMEKLVALRYQEPPSEMALKAYRYLYGEDSDKMNAMSRAQNAINSEIKAIAGLNGVSKEIAASYYEAYRKQYKEEYAHLPASERPDVPQEWVNTVNPTSGFRAPGMMGNYMPSDPASLYASYRLRSDAESIPSILKEKEVLYASIDLEVAGPSGNANLKRRDMFDPELGRIIEVGIVVYNSKGEVVQKYEALSKPDPEFFKAHGTGASEIHGITKSMISNSKPWPEVAPKVGEVLEGKIMLAQNASFEKSWLQRHLPTWDRDTLIVDTMDIAQKHLDIPNNKLSSICKKVGVPYTNGHRAMHDAEVAGEAFFAMQKRIARKWNSDSNRKSAPVAMNVPTATRWSTWRNPKYTD